MFLSAKHPNLRQNLLKSFLTFWIVLCHSNPECIKQHFGTFHLKSAIFLKEVVTSVFRDTGKFGSVVSVKGFLTYLYCHRAEEEKFLHFSKELEHFKVTFHGCFPPDYYLCCDVTSSVPVGTFLPFPCVPVLTLFGCLNIHEMVVWCTKVQS